MDLSPIDKLPEFKSNVPENARRQLNEGDKWLADTISVLSQEIRWIADKAIIAYNLSVDQEKWKRELQRKYESPLRLFLWILALLVSAYVGAVVNSYIQKGPQ